MMYYALAIKAGLPDYCSKNKERTNDVIGS